MDDIAEVDISERPGLYRVTSSSSTAYWVDTRPEHGPLLMRARGNGSTGRGPHDDRWVSLTSLISLPKMVRDGGGCCQWVWTRMPVLTR